MSNDIEELAAQVRVLSAVIEQTLVDAGNRPEAIRLLSIAILELRPAIEDLASVLGRWRPSPDDSISSREQRERIAALRIMQRVRERLQMH